MHLIKKHIRPFVCLEEVIIKYFSISEHLRVIKYLFHFIQENLMFDLFVKYTSHCLSYLFELKTFLKLDFYFLTKIFLNALTQIKSVYFLQ